jgi:tetratricopeptide (TPR) repeat protein
MTRIRAMRALLGGQFEEGERQAQEALAIGQQIQEPYALQAPPPHVGSLRREQGRFEELESSVRTFVKEYPGLPAWRCALALLYELLLPYAERCVVIGDAVACYSPASRYLGLLAATMARWEAAAVHFERALTTNERVGAKSYLAHTRYEYAHMLLTREGPGDTAKGSASGLQRALTLLDSAIATF